MFFLLLQAVDKAKKLIQDLDSQGHGIVVELFEVAGFEKVYVCVFH